MVPLRLARLAAWRTSLIQGAPYQLADEAFADAEGGLATFVVELRKAMTTVEGAQTRFGALSTVLNKVRYVTVQYSTVQYSAVQYITVQYSTVQYRRSAARSGSSDAPIDRTWYA